MLDVGWQPHYDAFLNWLLVTTGFPALTLGAIRRRKAAFRGRWFRILRRTRVMVGSLLHFFFGPADGGWVLDFVSVTGVGAGGSGAGGARVTGAGGGPIRTPAMDRCRSGN